MIRFYPSVLPGEPLIIDEPRGQSVREWVDARVPEVARERVTVKVDGRLVDKGEWTSTNLHPWHDVEIRPQPGGGATLIAAVVAAVVAVAATFLLKPSIPSQSNKTGGKGSSLLEASATGNKVKTGDVIPELAGRHRRFPDYLTAPRRRFVEPKVQALDLLLCVGKGEYEIDPDEIRIGNTRIGALSSAVGYQIFGPGETVTGHSAHQNWYNTPEVGPSVGANGIRLPSNRDADKSWPGQLTFSGDEITSSGELPNGWLAGAVIDIAIPQSVTISDPGAGADIIEGDFDYLMLSPGNALEIDGLDDASYRVLDYTPGAPGQLTLEVFVINQGWQPATGLPTGSRTITITRNGYDYEVVETLTDGLKMTARGTTGWPGFPTLTTSNASVTISSDELVGYWTLPFTACPEGEVTNTLEWDIFAPQGLCEIGESSGNIYRLYRDIEIRYRPVGGTTWTTLGQSVTGRTRDQIGWTFRLTLPYAMRPEVQVRRVKAESNDIQVVDRLEWYGLRARFDNAPSRYEGVTVIALTVTGSDAIASQTENQVSVVATRKLPVRENGAWTAPRPTRDIAPWFAHVARSVGYTDAEIDLDELDRLDAIWKARGDQFNFIEADDSTAKESLNRCLIAGMAELTIAAGKLSPARDEPQAVVEHSYSAQNVVSDISFGITMPRPDDHDGVDVEFINETTWEEDEVQCRLPGDQGFKTEKLRLDGVTSRTQAYQIGMRRRRELKYRRKEFTFSTELDALNSRYMRRNALITDVPGQGQSMILEGFEDMGGGDYRLFVTEPLDWSAGGAHVVAWRRADGTMAGPFPAAQGSAEDEVIMQGVTAEEDEPVIYPSMEPPHVYFGPESSWSHDVLITEINPNGFESVDVQAVGYDPRVYLDDDSVPA